jgi:hypothetical protein
VGEKRLIWLDPDLRPASNTFPCHLQVGQRGVFLPQMKAYDLRAKNRGKCLTLQVGFPLVIETCQLVPVAVDLNFGIAYGTDPGSIRDGQPLIDIQESDISLVSGDLP